MADYGLKVSKSGSSVLTATDENTSMTSKFNSFKVFAQGALQKAISPSSTFTVTVSHNLGYKPAFLVFSDSVVGGGKRFQVPFNDGAAYANSDATVDNSNLNIYISTGGFSGTGNLDMYYYIFVDRSDT